jgi:predicted phosphodiesterase
LIAVIGDTQATLQLERLFLRREQNDPHCARLLQKIAASRPDLLVHLGDMVAKGSRRKDWARFDRMMAPIHEATIPVLPVIGNHDLWGREDSAWRNLHIRFRALGRSCWYDQRHGPLHLIVLDSNLSRLPAAGRTEQAAWFEAKLSQADGDDGTAGVVVFAHHPPFTNSRATGDDLDVQKHFVKPFLSSRKSLAFIAGHTHAYERFQKDGKSFIVSGGGGGPRVRLHEGADARHADLFQSKSPRPLHYLVLRPLIGCLQVTAQGLDEDARGMTVLEEFSILYDQARRTVESTHE